MVPDSYDASKPSPWIIYNHGFGQTITSITANRPQSYFVQSLANAGYVVIASEYRNLSCWGDTQCTEDVANLQTLWRSLLNLAPQPYVIGESMGGIVTWNAISLGAVKPLAVVGIYPVCSLSNMYTSAEFAPTIQSAYGFNSPAQYSTATAGFDPLQTPPQTFTGFPILIWASYSDQAVSRSKNEDPFSAAINAAKGNVTLRTSHGNHGDPSNFDAPAVISFFASNPSP
jgi:alpha-beta hydrolase superfamily lysophospholipase